MREAMVEQKAKICKINIHIFMLFPSLLMSLYRDVSLNRHRGVTCTATSPFCSFYKKIVIFWFCATVIFMEM